METLAKTLTASILSYLEASTRSRRECVLVVRIVALQLVGWGFVSKGLIILGDAERVSVRKSISFQEICLHGTRWKAKLSRLDRQDEWQVEYGTSETRFPLDSRAH
jgi:hypothetical protein